MNHKYVFVIVLMALVVIGGTVAYANYVVSPTPTGYYLPKGYKVTAKVYVPDAPLWGNTIGDAVGLSCDKYSVIVFGWGEKTWNWEAKHGIKVIWREGGNDEDKAYVDLEPDKKHDVTIVYDWDGTVKISVDGKFIYSFVATESKYTIVAQGATVDEPEALPEPSTTPPTGPGYNRASVNELQTQYLLLGAGATIIAVAAIMMFTKGNKKQAARTSMALIIIIMLVLGMVGIATYYIYRSTQVTTVLPLPLTEEIGNKPVLTALQFGQITPGQVYEVAPDKQGWQIKEKDTKLYEKLELNSIDIGVNDVVVLHLFDWYLDGVDDCLVFDVDDFVYGSPFYGPQHTGSSWIVGFSYIDPPLEEYVYKPFGSSSHDMSFAISSTNRLYFRHLINVYIYLGDVVPQQWIDAGFSAHYVSDDTVEYSYVINSIDGEGTKTDSRFNQTIVIDVLHIASDSIYKGVMFHGRIGYAVFYTDYLDRNMLSKYVRTKVMKKPAFLTDATFYNGTHYFDLVTGNTATIYGNPIRIPSENPFLWLIKNFENDNKLHFKWFPEGTIVRIKDSSGNIVREFTITGERAGNTTLVLDYTVSLDTTTLVGATVEAFVPSSKVRVYAPASSYVALLGDDGTKYGEYQVGFSGYVDIPLVNPLKNAYIVVYADNEAEEGLNIDVKDLGGGKIQVKVYNDKGVLIPGMLVRLVDPANVVLDYGVTDESGTVVLDAGRPLAEAKILVDGVWDGTIYKLSKSVTLAETMDAEAEPVANTNEQYRYALLGLFIIVLLAALVFIVKRR